MRRPDVKTLALELAPVRWAVAAGLSARAVAARDPYARAAALLRAWRTADSPLVARPASRHLRRRLVRRGRPVRLADNPLLRSFVRGPAARAIRREFAGYPRADAVRLRYPRPDEPEARQGDLIVLKDADDASGEKGVLLVKYSESFGRFAAVFEVERLARRYMIVLEPSWWGYQDASFFLYVGRDADVVVQAQAGADFRFLDDHGLSLVPVRLGAGDWIDPEMFRPADGERRYDVVMVSSWSPFKRHADLLAALRRVRVQRGRSLRTALVGYPSGMTERDIRGMVERHGLAAQCDVFDSIPQTRVADIVARSRLYVLLSRREGANKAMYEAMFCDTPVLAPDDHRGINHEHLNAATGMTFDRGRLSDALLAALGRADACSPRAWALENTGYRNATHRLERALAGVAERRGVPWTRPIVAKKNRPNLWYASDGDRRALDAAYERLAGYLRPVDS